MVKTCTGCHKELAATKENFHCSKDCKFGLMSKCKKCRLECRKKYVQENKIKIAKTAKKYREENKIKLLKYQRKYVQENKIKIAKHNKKYKEKNKIKIAKYNKKYFQEIKENLNGQYLKILLEKQGFSKEQMTPEIIELKLILIKTKRL
jgi:hypothetical protein